MFSQRAEEWRTTVFPNLYWRAFGKADYCRHASDLAPNGLDDGRNLGCRVVESEELPWFKFTLPHKIPIHMTDKAPPNLDSCRIENPFLKRHIGNVDGLRPRCAL